MNGSMHTFAGRATGEAAMPPVRGRLTANAPLAPLVWFKSGGNAQWLFEIPLATPQGTATLASAKLPCAAYPESTWPERSST